MTGPTRIGSDQARFISQNTGSHILDQYLEDAERGGKPLADLMALIFTEEGNVSSTPFQTLAGFRVVIQNPTGEITYGSEQDATSPSGAFFFRFMGPWAPLTEYKRLDLIVHAGVTYAATADFTASGLASPAPADLASMHPISTGLGGVVYADDTDAHPSQLVNKLKVIGGTTTVIEEGGVRKVQVDLQTTIDALNANIATTKPLAKALFLEIAL